MKRIVTLFIAIAFMVSMVSVFAAVGNNDIDSAAEKIAEAGIGRYDKPISRGEAIILMANAIGLNEDNIYDVMNEEPLILATFQTYVEQFSYDGARYAMRLLRKGITIGRVVEPINDWDPTLALDPWNNITLAEGVTMLIKAHMTEKGSIDLETGYERALEMGLISEADEFNKGPQTRLNVGYYYIILSRFLDLPCNPDKSFFRDVENPEDYTYFELLKMQNFGE